MDRGLPIPETWWASLPVLANIALAMAGFYLAWRIWRWRQALVTLRVQFEQWQGQLGRSANPALIQLSQAKLTHFKQTYTRISQQFQKGGQILTWVGLAWRLRRGWRWPTRVRTKGTRPWHHHRHEKR